MDAENHNGFHTLKNTNYNCTVYNDEFPATVKAQYNCVCTEI